MSSGLAEGRYRDSAIAVLLIIPGLAPRLIDAQVTAGVRGIILECYGVGTAPDSDSIFLAAVGRAAQTGILVLATSQCGDGSVELATYAAGGAPRPSGALSAAST